MNCKLTIKLSLVAGLFVLAMATNRPSYAACSAACEQRCVQLFDNCVNRVGGWHESCQQIYDNCAYRCGC